MATVNPAPRLERSLDGIVEDLLDRNHQAKRCWPGSIMHVVMHAQLDALLDEWEAAR